MACSRLASFASRSWPGLSLRTSYFAVIDTRDAVASTASAAARSAASHSSQEPSTNVPEASVVHRAPVARTAATARATSAETLAEPVPTGVTENHRCTAPSWVARRVGGYDMGMPRDTPLHTIMTSRVITVRPEMPIEDAAALLAENGISGAPVVDAAGRPLGLLDDTDLITSSARLDAPTTLHLLGAYLPLPGEHRRFSEELQHALAQTVGEVMHDELPMLGPDDTVEDAATIMTRQGVGRVGIVDEQHRIIGIVTRTDLIKGMVEGMVEPDDAS